MKDHEKYAEEVMDKVDDIIHKHPVLCGTYCLGGTPNWFSLKLKVAIIHIQGQIEVMQLDSIVNLSEGYDEELNMRIKAIDYLKEKL